MNLSKIKSIYQPIYNEMRSRNTDNILRNNTKFDEALTKSEIDQRKGLAIFGYFPQSLGLGFDTLFENASKHFDEHIVYSPKHTTPENIGLLHLTFLQLLKVGDVNHRLSKDIILRYVKLLEKFILRLSPFRINFEGVIAIPTGLALYGYPSIDVNKIRQQIRQDFVDKNLPFSEPYPTDIIHSTLVRFTRPNQSQKALNFTTKYEKISKLDGVKIDKLFLGYGSWKMKPQETKMLYEFNLSDKTVTQLQPN